MKLIAFTLTLFLTGMTYGQEIKFKTITIDPYLSFQNYEHFKRLTLSSPDSYAEYIAGFEFQWGYTYKLRVKETELRPSLSDGSRFEYSLVDIISKTKESDNSEFKLFLDANRYYYEVDSTEQEMNKTFWQINDSTFLYFDKVEIELPSFIIEEFKSIVEGKTSKVGTFIYIDDKRIRLIKL